MSLLMLVGLVLACIHDGHLLQEYNLYQKCGQTIYASTVSPRGILLYFERSPRYYNALNDGPCTVEIYCWISNDLAMHFISLNTGRNTFVEIRQGDSWAGGRPISGMPHSFSNSSLNDLNRVFTTDWLGIFIRISGIAPSYGTRMFELVINAFHLGKCFNLEHKCDNSRCIDKDLKCNGYNPCGDSSDCNSGGPSAWIIVCPIIGGMLGFTCLLIYVNGRHNKRRQENPPPVTRRYAQSSMGRSYQHDESRGNDNPSLHFRSDTNIAVLDMGDRPFDAMYQNGSRQRGAGLNYSSEPPNYHNVMNGENTSQQQNSPVTSPPDYTAAVTQTQYTPTVPTEEQLDVDSSAYLPSYSDVLQNEEAYRVNLEAGNTIVYRV